MQKYQDNGLRGAVLAASIELIMAGEPVTHQTLRARGVHGATATLLALRSELVRDGELPESVMPRKYVFGNPERGKVPEELFRVYIRAAAEQIVANGDRVTLCGLRMLGVRGGSARVLDAVDDLIRTGAIPAQSREVRYGGRRLVHRQTVDPDAPLRSRISMSMSTIGPGSASAESGSRPGRRNP